MGKEKNLVERIESYLFMTRFLNKPPRPGSDNIQVYIQPERYSKHPIGRLRDAKFRTPTAVIGIEHLRATIYNPRTDKIFIIRDGDRGPLKECHRGATTEIMLKFTNARTRMLP